MGPKNVGIKAIELYFPNQCVEQNELEKFDGVSEGKYTVGLGQTKMGFCDDREDIYSLALTAVSSLMRKYDITPGSIGRVEVGTETVIDKSKSVKSVLMQLFEHCNTNIEGTDTVNACYGGTNALLNAVNWVESSSWDGRDAIVVAGDIALYQRGNARPTGGAGCVAILVGPDSPLALEPGLRGSYSRHTYDFYKPDFGSEYPYVDGPLSLRCYTEALDACYIAYAAKDERQRIMSVKEGDSTSAVDCNGHHSNSNGIHTNGIKTNGVNGVNGNGVKGDNLDIGEHDQLPADRFDYMCFHAPTCKTVAKAYARLYYNDFLSHKYSERFAQIPPELGDLSYGSSLIDKKVEKTFLALAKDHFKRRVEPAIYVPTQCGNMYCASLYSSLCSLIGLVDSDELQGKRIGMFSYGSGLASTMFSIRVVGSTRDLQAKLDLQTRLEERRVVTPKAYDETCQVRERAHQQKPYTPTTSLDGLVKGTYYLLGVDKMFRRTYGVKE